jgi:two-component system phosphate regulon sensor histidine kinase PhoR
VIGFASVLQESFHRMDNATVEELIELILQSTERLKMIVDELVDFAAIHREPTDGLHVVDLDLHRLLQKSFKVLEQQITEKNILYRLELSDAPFIIRGDQLILGEVIYHLLDNAVSFNKPNGQIIVRANRLTASPKKGATGVTVIEIEDTGIGIPQAELGKIFDKFYQVEEHMTRTVGGLGLGLTIARQGVERHGGRLTVTSQLGRGSIFQIILPAIAKHPDVSIDDRADMAHQQTLAYAKDMARAVVDQRQMTQKMKQVNSLGTGLQGILNKLAEAGSKGDADQEALEQAQQIIQEMRKLSDQG